MDFKNKYREFSEGKLSQSEAKEFLEFLESKEAEVLLSAEIIQLWSDTIKAGDLSIDTNELWKKINQKRNVYTLPSQQKEPKLKKASNLTWLRAAVVFVVLGLATLFYIQDRQVKNHSLELAIEDTMITNTNKKGEKTKVTLEDGSVVYLNSQSSITYSKNFKANRSIQLEGEAFFEVVKDPDHPFVVDAKGIVTTALGTSFNISTFKKDQKVAVTLLTGKVKLNQSGKEAYIELNPGEESLLSPDLPEMEKYKVKSADKILWTQGILSFDEATLDEMVEILQRWYGVTIKINGQPQALNASGVFDNQESLRNVLNVMGKTLEFEFVMDGQKITLNFN
ncbi:ferric-dicitrate binding protein FerR, regulates iron transport through sigma-19 [Algoriphagus locisalis]|uniref:Ferric-dicitrate binding protein FerR, regulates iron transport through sigma-19 n=1 Tax=Algoriphagus locisalis TaxID=305507 RepID=A0A1I7C9X0_9BACT|nr:FecR domain-containing protein [Algoriphagus locisalis]SFT96204.1 ferric-dicitrate binding protein FerR, regulates iron transport through sigma-19 [Algoriphagus locisalis]